MMTTHTKDSNLLVSRCIALAAKGPCLTLLSSDIDLIFHTNTESDKTKDIASNAISAIFLNSSGE